MALRPEQTLAILNELNAAAVEKAERFIDDWLSKRFDGKRATVALPSWLKEREQNEIQSRYSAAGWQVRWEGNQKEQFLILSPANDLTSPADLLH